MHPPSDTDRVTGALAIRETAVSRKGGGRPLTRRIGRGTIAIAIALLGVATVAYIAGVRMNLSGSIPPGLYQIAGGPVARGAIVLVCLPPPTAAFARVRGYVPSGSCADGSAPIGKTVAASHGDTVDVAPNGIAVNGHGLLNSRPLGVDSQNRPLRPFAPGRYVVGQDEVWLVSSYSARSFDSRYFGPVKIARIVARVRPFLRTR